MKRNHETSNGQKIRNIFKACHFHFCNVACTVQMIKCHKEKLFVDSKSNICWRCLWYCETVCVCWKDISSFQWRLIRSRELYIYENSIPPHNTYRVSKSVEENRKGWTWVFLSLETTFWEIQIESLLITTVKTITYTTAHTDTVFFSIVSHHLFCYSNSFFHRISWLLTWVSIYMDFKKAAATVKPDSIMSQQKDSAFTVEAVAFHSFRYAWYQSRCIALHSCSFFLLVCSCIVIHSF